MEVIDLTVIMGDVFAEWRLSALPTVGELYALRQLTFFLLT